MKTLLLTLTLLGWMLNPLAADSGCTRHLQSDLTKAACGSCATTAAKTACACQDGGTCACPAGKCACAEQKACCKSGKDGIGKCENCAKACDADSKQCADCTKACPTCGAAAVAATNEPAGHPLTGVVVQVMPARQALLVKHEEIPGVMRAMTMMLRVDEPTLTAVKADDVITATLYRDAEGRWALRNVKGAQG